MISRNNVGFRLKSRSRPISGARPSGILSPRVSVGTVYLCAHSLQDAVARLAFYLSFSTCFLKRTYYTYILKPKPKQSCKRLEKAAGVEGLEGGTDPADPAGPQLLG